LKKIKIGDICKYLGLFLFFVLIFTFFCYDNSSYDFLWNYGFSFAVSRGEIPYVNFNTISTPLYILLQSIPLRICDDFLVFMIFQSLLCTLLFYIFFKYAKDVGWLFLPIMAFPLFRSFIGTYNFLALFFLVVLFYLESIDKDDFIIGIFLGLLIFSKQTIGGVALILSFIFLKDLKRIGKRLLGVLVVSLVFLVYFILNGSFSSFINLCFLGLFDFSKSNGNYFNFYMFLAVMIIGVILYDGKRRKDIRAAYALSSFFFVFPLFDYYHFSLFLTVVFLYFCLFIKADGGGLRRFSLIVTGVIFVLGIILKRDMYKDLERLDLPSFRYYLVKKEEAVELREIYNDYKKRDNAYMVGDQAMLFDVAARKEITYFDVTLKGNYGYDGTSKMIEKVEDMNNKYFYINEEQLDKYQDFTQLDYKLIDYIRKNSRKIGCVSYYSIYYKE